MVLRPKKSAHAISTTFIERRPIAIRSSEPRPGKTEIEAPKAVATTQWLLEMAAPSPVPSRAALNALRGVILTTSCSVVLVAEERRRRIKVARAAIDNARKLHTVRVNHGPALSEGMERREALHAELLEGLPPMPFSPQNTGAPRRRRRDGQPSHSSATARNIESKLSLDESSSTMQGDNPSASHHKEWSEWDADRKEIMRLSLSSPFVYNELFLRATAEDETPIPPLTTQELRGKNTAIEVVGPVEASNPAYAREPGTELPSQNNDPTTAQDSTRHSRTTAETPSAGDTSHNASLGEDLVSSVEPKTDVELETYIGERQTRSEDLLVSLDSLLNTLESSSAIESAVAEQQDSAVVMLQDLISANYLNQQQIISKGLRLLEKAVTFKQYDKMPTIIETTLPSCTDILQLVVPIMAILQRSGDVKGVRVLLEHSSDIGMNKSTASDSTARTSWITRLISYKWKSKNDLEEIKNVYRLLQKAGLFKNASLSSVTQYAIRRRIAMIAFDAGDDALADTEVKHLYALRPEGAKSDLELQAKLISRDAKLGNWDSVRTTIAELEGSQEQSIDFKKAVGHIYQPILEPYVKAHTHSPEELENFIRHLVDEYGVVINQAVAFSVIDGYGRNCNVASLTKWIQYCQNNSVRLEQSFMNRVFSMSHKYWNLTPDQITGMFEEVRVSMRWLQRPRLMKYSSNGALEELQGSGPRTKEAERTTQLVPEKANGDERFERDIFTQMNTRALKNDWEQVYEVYNEALDRSLGFSIRCLRLAVIANIRKDGGKSNDAARLVREAHAEGHDVSSALVPLLVARMEEGEDAADLIQDTLRQGGHIHDSVYNKAARQSSQRGYRHAAVKLCKLAAQENGNGELAYNKYNFVNLVSAYSCLGWYNELAPLLASFMSKKVWWNGSKECKESIKLAMKIIGVRAVKNPRDNCEHEDALICLDHALQHVKECRATVKDDRLMLTEGLVDAMKTEGQQLLTSTVRTALPKPRDNVARPKTAADLRPVVPKRAKDRYRPGSRAPPGSGRRAAAASGRATTWKVPRRTIPASPLSLQQRPAAIFTCCALKGAPTCRHLQQGGNEKPERIERLNISESLEERADWLTARRSELQRGQGGAIEGGNPQLFPLNGSEQWTDGLED
ncbi:hypothetical protein G7046_g3627 [Stylonectria norvegica]|nr:hypothetical protein G7046_g3627 [Stylonectria norvegica]